MPRRRAVETMERDAQAVDLRRRHLSYRQIAAQMGYKDASTALRAVQRGLADMSREAADEVRQIELDRLDDIARGFWRVFLSRHYVVAVGSGTIAVDPETRQPLTDHGPVIQSGLALLRISERRARLLGLDAPARTRVEVIDDSVIEAEIRKLEAEVGRNPGRAEAGAPPVSP